MNPEGGGTSLIINVLNGPSGHQRQETAPTCPGLLASILFLRQQQQHSLQLCLITPLL
jgi:hypothetical protein